MDEYVEYLRSSADEIWQVLLHYLGPDCPLKCVYLVVLVSGGRDDEGVALSYLQEKLGVEKQVISRLVYSLTAQRGSHGLLTIDADPLDARRKRIFLSPRGKELKARITTIQRDRAERHPKAASAQS